MARNIDIAEMVKKGTIDGAIYLASALIAIFLLSAVGMSQYIGFQIAITDIFAVVVSAALAGIILNLLKEMLGMKKMGLLEGSVINGIGFAVSLYFVVFILNSIGQGQLVAVTLDLANIAGIAVLSIVAGLIVQLINEYT